jgi:hypothetical protein
VKTAALAICLLIAAGAASAQQGNYAEYISPAGEPDASMSELSHRATIYIEPLKGFDIYLAAALRQKSVPIKITVDRSKADFVVAGTWHEGDPSWESFLGVRGHTDDSAAIEMVEVKSGDVVYAYAVNKKQTMHGEQTSAEAFAKHLKEWMH